MFFLNILKVMFILSFPLTSEVENAIFFAQTSASKGEHSKDRGRVSDSLICQYNSDERKKFKNISINIRYSVCV